MFLYMLNLIVSCVFKLKLTHLISHGCNHLLHFDLLDNKASTHFLLHLCSSNFIVSQIFNKFASLSEYRFTSPLWTIIVVVKN